MAGPTLTANGLTIQTLDQIVADLVATMQALFGQTVQAGSGTAVIGRLVGAIADLDSAVQEALQAVYLSGTLDGAAGVSLDRLVALGGLTRKAAVASTVTVQVTNPTGAPITVPLGALLEITTSKDRFAVNAATVIGAGLTVDVACHAVEPGAVPVPATATWAWVSSFAGSASLTLANSAAGNEGSETETDAALRVRFVESLHAPGAGTLDSIIAAVLAVETVKPDAAAFENVELAMGIATPEVIGTLPGKSFVVVERDGVAADVAQAIWEKKPAGIKSFGNTTVNVIDSQGFTQPISFEVAALVVVHIEVTVSGSGASFTAAIKAAIVAYGDGLDIAADVIALKVRCAAIDAAGPNATDVTAKIDTVDPPVATGNLSIAWNKRASILTANIDVVHV